MILVFGGTTEGKQVITVLESLGLPYVYSTKTKIEVILGKYGVYRYGTLTKSTLKSYIASKKIDLILHASHPFAEVLHQTISSVTAQTKTTVLRIERKYPTRTIHQKVHYVNNYREASFLLQQQFTSKRLLALTGVQSIEKLSKHWQKNTTFFRILDRKSSIDLALKHAFPKEQLILGLPSKSVETEVATLKAYQINVIITKESGNSGSLSVKIDAALQTGSAIIIIKKPETPTSFLSIRGTDHLNAYLSGHYSSLSLHSSTWA